MKLYEIALPLRDNSGNALANAHARWKIEAVDIAGGMTERPEGQGYWRAPNSARMYIDEMRPYQFACDAPTFRKLVALARKLFPDQIAFWTAEIGQAKIIPADEIS